MTQSELLQLISDLIAIIDRLIKTSGLGYEYRQRLMPMRSELADLSYHLNERAFELEWPEFETNARDLKGLLDGIDAAAGEIQTPALVLDALQRLDNLTRHCHLLRTSESGGGAPPGVPPAFIIKYGLPAAVRKPSGPIERKAAFSVKTEEPATRVVNTGIAERNLPAGNVDIYRSLATNLEYWFFVEVGKLLPGSMEETPTPLPPTLPEGGLLTVSVFAFPGQLEITPGADEGTLRVTGPGSAEVAQQPGTTELRDVNPELLTRRLLFPIKTPSSPGVHHLRCNIYFNHVLLQSRLVTAAVGMVTEEGAALRSTLDYNLSHTLDPAHFTRLGEQQLSVLINANGDGTHGFFFHGGTDFRSVASLDAPALQDIITQVRKRFRMIAWGTDQPWRSKELDRYRYATKPNRAEFERDLEALAIRGYMSYYDIIKELSGGPGRRKELAAIMRNPGRVQISSQESTRLIVPAAVLYDYPLDTQRTHTICDAFLQSLESGEELVQTPCFKGNCPHYGDLAVVCPGGFWGYRHELGLPVSISEPQTGDAAIGIDFSDPPWLAAVVSLDPMLAERSMHEQHLRTIRKPLTWLLCEDRATALDMLQHKHPQIVYFYCHGGSNEDNVAYLGIGNNEYITPDNILAFEIHWVSPRPLVFLNGCMTTALEPEKAMEFVTAFVSDAGASGVIGTEITVFEPLATKFAEIFLREFLCESKPLGCAVRLARLALLQEWNPLGLVYIPFALPGLQIGKSPSQGLNQSVTATGR